MKPQIMWAVVSVGGCFIGPVQHYKRDAIAWSEANLAKPWRTIRRRYGLRVVKVRVEEVE